MSRGRRPRPAYGRPMTWIRWEHGPEFHRPGSLTKWHWREAGGTLLCLPPGPAHPDAEVHEGTPPPAECCVRYTARLRRQAGAVQA
jgi:hypothetical protein